jgi:hypothetical protein
MPLQSTGVISLSNIQTEFGGTNPISLSEYYQNAASGYTSGISGIPNGGGVISISNFYGKSKNVSPPYSTSITARYTADGPFTKNVNTITQWNDLSGNNRHITSAYFKGNVIQSTFTQGSKGLTGTSTLNSVKGTFSDGLYFPFALTNASYTFCYIARYTGNNTNTTYNRRIFEARNGTGENTIWGFHANYPGRSHNGNRGWVSSTEKKQSEPDWWIIGVDTEISARYNGMDCTDIRTFQGSVYPLRPSVAGYNPTPSINYGAYTGGSTNSSETSNWEVMELIFYNRELTNAEKIAVETYFANKYKHISFTNISLDYDSFFNNCSNQIVLYDLFNFIYNGYKWGYGSLSMMIWIGPGIKYSEYYKKNDNYFWIINLQNGNSNNINLKYSNGGNRNINNIIYTIPIPNIADAGLNFQVHCIINGGGGGGSAIGAGAGGQTYFYNCTKIYGKNLTLNIGNRGSSSAYYNTNCSGGGDTTVSWDTYSLIGYGGREGDSGTGGANSFTVPPNMLAGGANGGNGFSYNGGAISTITNNVTLYTNTTLWNIINDSSIANVYSYNSTWWWTNIYGAGGMGYRGGISGDPYARAGGTGGPGFVIIIFDYNTDAVI